MRNFSPWGGKPRAGVGLKQIARAPTAISKPTASSWGSCLEAHSTDEETEVGCLSLCLSHTITRQRSEQGRKIAPKLTCSAPPGAVEPQPEMVQLVKCNGGETCHRSSLPRRRGSPTTFGELSSAVDAKRLNSENPLLLPDLLGELLRDPQMGGAQ